MVPPMTPPAACNTEKKATPPKGAGFMKRFPITMPATAVEATDAKSKLITLNIGFSKQF